MEGTIKQDRFIFFDADTEARDAGLSDKDNEKIREQLASLGYM